MKILRSLLPLMPVLAVRAHEVDPPRLPSSSFATAMVLFSVAIAFRVGVLLLRFRRPR